MHPFLSVPLGLTVLTVEGILILLLLEGKSSVLYRFERVCIGLLFGGSFSAFVIFFALLIGVPLTLGGFLVVHGMLLACLFLLAMRNGRSDDARHSAKVIHLISPSSPPLPIPSFQVLRRSLPRWVLSLGLMMLLWTGCKIALGAYDLFLTPSYFNDVYANWNMRAKVFFLEEDLLLDRDPSDPFFFGGRVPSYPLTVYFTKVWLAELSGEWSEGVVNSVHLFWFLSALGVLFTALLRRTIQSDICRCVSRRINSPANATVQSTNSVVVYSFLWAFLGTYLLVSLPLYLMHGINAYADVLLSAHLLTSFVFLFEWILAMEESKKETWLKLFSVSTALMLFVKSEALLIFLPPLTLLFLLAAFFQSQSRKEFFRPVCVFALSVSLIAIPWVMFKLTHGLAFGNAQEVSGIKLFPHAGVPNSIYHGLFYTGSFLLLFPLFLSILVLGWRKWLPVPPILLRLKEEREILGLTTLTVFLLIVFGFEFLLYYLTPLALEALKQTGFSRGFLQLTPSMLFLSVLILRSLISAREGGSLLDRTTSN